MSAPYYIAVTRLTANNASATIKIISDKKPAKLIKIAKKFFDGKTWYTDKEFYKALGELEQCKTTSDAEIIHHTNGLVSFEVGRLPVQEPRLGMGEF